MLVHVDSSGVSYSNHQRRYVPSFPLQPVRFSDENRHYTPGYVRHTGMFDVLQRDEFDKPKAFELMRRVMNGEPLWFMHGGMDGPLCPNSIFKHRLKATQAKLLPLLCQTYDCDTVDAEGLVNAGVDHTPPEQAFASVCSFVAQTSGNEFDAPAPLGWRRYAEAIAWLMDVSEAARIPHLQSLGFDFDKAQKMDADACESWGTFIGTQFAIQAGERLIENVNIAAKVALDSPQPVTIDVGPKDDEGKTDFTITFENVRLSPQVAGLRITMPTGGIVFLRDAYLHPETGDVCRHVHARSLRVSNRYIARRIVEQLANDTQCLSEGWLTPTYTRPPEIWAYLRSRGIID